MTIEAVISRLDCTTNPDSASSIPSSPDSLLIRLKRIESILRNALPTDDKAEANTITHAHSEVENALEDIDPERWGQ